jgi:hypothetical protein
MFRTTWTSSILKAAFMSRPLFSIRGLLTIALVCMSVGCGGAGGGGTTTATDQDVKEAPGDMVDPGASKP